MLRMTRRRRSIGYGHSIISLSVRPLDPESSCSRHRFCGSVAPARAGLRLGLTVEMHEHSQQSLES